MNALKVQIDGFDITAQQAKEIIEALREHFNIAEPKTIGGNKIIMNYMRELDPDLALDALLSIGNATSSKYTKPRSDHDLIQIFKEFYKIELDKQQLKTPPAIQRKEKILHMAPPKTITLKAYDPNDQRERANQGRALAMYMTMRKFKFFEVAPSTSNFFEKIKHDLVNFLNSEEKKGSFKKVNSDEIEINLDEIRATIFKIIEKHQSRNKTSNQQ